MQKKELQMKEKVKNRKAYLDKEHNFTIREEDVPEPECLEVLVQIKANGICGSDVHFFKEGKLGNFIVTKPYVPGHECSGVVAAVGSGVKGFREGDAVTIEPGIPCGKCSLCRDGRYNLCPDVVFLSAPPVDGTFCDYVCVPYDMVFKIPEGLPFDEAAMIEPAAVAVQAVKRAVFPKGASGTVIGAGPIGLLTMQAFKAAGGGSVTCVDTNRFRLDFAKRLGADAVYNPTFIIPKTDVAFETAGADKATESLFSYLNPGGCAVQVGWPRSNHVPMDIARFIEKELTYVSVNRYANAYPAAIRWISDGRIKVKEMITHRFNLDDVSEAFSFTAENQSVVIKTVVLN